MFKIMSLKSKLMLAFSFVSLFVITIALMGYFSMKKVHREYSYISDVLLSNLQDVSELNDSAHEAHRLMFRAYMTLEDDQTVYQTIKNDYEEQVKKMESLNAGYRSTPFAIGEEEIYDPAWKAWLEYKEGAIKYLALIEAARIDKEKAAEARRFMSDKMRVYRLDIRNGFQNLIKFQSKIVKEKSEIATSAYHTSSLLSIVVSVAGILFAISIGLFFSTRISKTMGQIAEQILNSSSQTAAASQQLTSASSQLSQGATESAASLQQTVSSLEELSSMVKLNSDHAKEANSLSQRSLQSAEQGEKDISKLINAMGDMSKSSKKIEEIINVIDDIAFQTNLLALNAAVEAARAGDQGKGFAVVADAVRNLAGRSAAAAKDINSLIKENVAKTDEGVDIADTSGSSLKEILSSVKKVADLNSEIAAASQEQASGIEQISKAMNHLDQAIQTNASSSEEVASSAEEMSSQADCLSSLVFDMKKFIQGESSGLRGPTQLENLHRSPAFKVVSGQPSISKKAKAMLPMDESEEAVVGKAEGF